MERNTWMHLLLLLFFYIKKTAFFTCITCIVIASCTPTTMWQCKHTHTHTSYLTQINVVTCGRRSNCRYSIFGCHVQSLMIWQKCRNSSKFVDVFFSTKITLSFWAGKITKMWSKVTISISMYWFGRNSIRLSFEDWVCLGKGRWGVNVNTIHLRMNIIIYR